MADTFLKLDTAKGMAEAKPITQSSGSANAGQIIATDSGGKIDASFLPNGIGADTRSIPAYEALSAGDLVNLFSDSGTLKARKANAASGSAYAADGFVTAAVASGQTATVYFDGTIAGLSSLTIGSKYYLSATVAGGVSSTIPTTAGQIYQFVGKAASATELVFEAGESVERA